MNRAKRVFRVGDLTITRIDELTLQGALPEGLYNQSLPADALERHRDWLFPANMDTRSGHLIQSTHCWLVQSPDFTLLVDTASGNSKERPRNPVFHRLNTDFLAQLAEAGVTPETIDYVLLTHLHVDHVGWNTRLKNGEWVPTFPNATYVFSAREAEYYASTASENTVNIPNLGVFADSVLPVIKAGKAQLVPGGEEEVLDGIRFIHTPGHSLDHRSISIRSRGEEALFAGDLMHHPLQIYYPELNSKYCEFPGPARASRLWALHYAATHKAVWFSTHFAGSSAGCVSRREDGFAWHFIE